MLLLFILFHSKDIGDLAVSALHSFHFWTNWFQGNRVTSKYFELSGDYLKLEFLFATAAQLQHSTAFAYVAVDGKQKYSLLPIPSRVYVGESLHSSLITKWPTIR